MSLESVLTEALDAVFKSNDDDAGYLTHWVVAASYLDDGGTCVRVLRQDGQPSYITRGLIETARMIMSE